MLLVLLLGDWLLGLVLAVAGLAVGGLLKLFRTCGITTLDLFQRGNDGLAFFHPGFLVATRWVFFAHGLIGGEKLSDLRRATLTIGDDLADGVLTFGGFVILLHGVFDDLRGEDRSAAENGKRDDEMEGAFLHDAMLCDLFD